MRLGGVKRADDLHKNGTRSVAIPRACAQKQDVKKVSMSESELARKLDRVVADIYVHGDDVEKAVIRCLNPKLHLGE